MTKEHNSTEFLSDFINYLAIHDQAGSQSLPPLNELSKTLNISVATLREQLEVARVLGLVDVRPRKGIRKLPYKFSPAVRLSLAYSLTCNIASFEEFADLRKHIEETYWHEAVGKLTAEDLIFLKSLITKAWTKLNGQPVQIPHIEHRLLHISIYRKLDNEFVNGLLEAYWDAYETIGLNVYTDLSYMQKVWQYHHEMVDAIINKEYDLGYQKLVEHADLINQRPRIKYYQPE